MRLNLGDLRVFCSAARQPTLGAAALELHLTPSAVSKALRRLEAPLLNKPVKPGKLRAVLSQLLG